MPRAKTFDERETLQRIGDLFWEKGYSATSVDEISRYVGLKKTSIYNAYGDKASLFTKALDAYLQDVFEIAGRFLKNEQPVSIEVSAALHYLLVEQNAALLDRGCLVVNSLLELTHSEPDLFAHVQAGLGRVANAFTDYFKNAKADGRLNRDADPEALAAFAMAVFQGMRVQARARAAQGFREQIINMAMTAIHEAERDRTDAKSRETPMRKNSGKSHDETILWAGPGSAYSARIFSYMTKKGIPFRRIFPGHPRFQEEIVPLVGYFVMPVMELTNGDLIQDSTDAMLYWESEVPDSPLIPTSPRQKATSALLAFFGAEMMLRIGMHYRWNYLKDDRPFAEAMFANFFSNARDVALKRKDTAPIMDYFGGFLPDLAITDETVPAIEAAYFDILDVLNAHFLNWPYLLGGRPSPADFGFITLLFAHLARDPHSAQIMKLRAPQVFRWTERMNEAGIVDGEFSDIAPTYLPDDELPDTLLPVLGYLLQENKAEILGMITSFNAWCDAQGDLESGTPLRTDPDTLSAHPKLGEFSFNNRGVTFRMQTLASVIFSYQRALDEMDVLDAAGRSRFEQTLSELNGEYILLKRPKHRIRMEGDQYSIA